MLTISGQLGHREESNDILGGRLSYGPVQHKASLTTFSASICHFDDHMTFCSYTTQ